MSARPRWPQRDAQRIIRRVHHAMTTDSGVDAAQVSYLRGQVAHLLIGPLADELPDSYAAYLRYLLADLEHIAGVLAEEGSA